MWQKIKALKESRGQVLADMKAILNKAETEKRDLSAEESGKFDALSTQAEAKLTEIRRYEKLAEHEGQQFTQAPGRQNTTEQRTETTDANQQMREEWVKYLRNQIDPTEARALTVGSMGVVGDRPFYTGMVKAMKAFAGVLEAGATVVGTDSGNELSVPIANDTNNIGQLIGEAVPDDTEADPSLGVIPLNAFKYDSKWIKVSTEMLRDSAFDVEAMIQGIAAERIGRIFNTHATSGTGTAQPKGFVTAATVGVAAADDTNITYEELMDLVHSLDAAYRNTGRAKWQFADLTLAAIRKLKDGEGRYIFNPGAGGAPDLVLGYGYVVNNHMATPAATKKPVAFGDFSRYFVRNVSAVEIVRANELFIAAGLVGFRVYSRHDGDLMDTSAIKTLQMAA